MMEICRFVGSDIIEKLFCSTKKIIKYSRAESCHLVTMAPVVSKEITVTMLFNTGPTTDVEALLLNMYSKYLGRKVKKPTMALSVNMVPKTCRT